MTMRENWLEHDVDKINNMKNKICLIICFNFFFINLFSQNKDGIYCDESNIQCFKLNNDSFILIDSTYGGHISTRREKIIAEGSIEQAAPYFYRIDSYTEYYDSVYDAVEVIQNQDENISSDSIAIQFDFPFQKQFGKKGIIIYLNVNYFQTEMKDIFYMVIPKQKYLDTDLLFMIFYYTPYLDSNDGRYFGRIAFEFSGYPIKSDINSILIKIPNLDARYFERYYITGEYIEIKNDELQWRGKRFFKVNKDF